MTAQLQQPEIDALPFSERLALLVDIQHGAMLTAPLEQRLSRAGMRQSACVENLDLRTPRGLDRSTMQALAGGQWIREYRNVLVSGPAGIRKSWIACALGNQADRDGVSVLYKRLSRLLDELAVARLHGRQARAHKTLARTRLLILDEWAMVKLTAEQRRDLMEVVDDRHGRGSTIIATQIPLDRWHEQIGDPTYADAILDRLAHNANRLELKGESMRCKAARKAAEDVAVDVHPSAAVPSRQALGAYGKGWRFGPASGGGFLRPGQAGNMMSTGRSWTLASSHQAGPSLPHAGPSR